MPLPKRRPGESKIDFLKRFLSDKKVQKEFPDKKQRLAIAIQKASEND